jgi:hypothetical protein
MKILTVDEVLKAEIPEGEYYLALEVLREFWGLSADGNGSPSKKGILRNKSLCLAFSVLMAYAKGELVEKGSECGTCGLARSVSEALNSGDGVYRP